MNAYALYPTRPKIPTWVSLTLAGLGATFVLLTVAVAVVVVRSQNASAASISAALPPQKALVAPAAPVAVAAAVTPSADDSTADAPAVAPAAKKHHASHKHVAAKRTYVASAARPAAKGKHKKDDLEKLLGL